MKTSKAALSTDELSMAVKQFADQGYKTIQVNFLHTHFLVSASNWSSNKLKN